jgi:hypothetical protein
MRLKATNLKFRKAEPTVWEHEFAQVKEILNSAPGTQLVGSEPGIVQIEMTDLSNRRMQQVLVGLKEGMPGWNFTNEATLSYDLPKTFGFRTLSAR